MSPKNPFRDFNKAGRDGSPSRPSSDDRSSTPSTLSEKSPHQVLPYRVRKSLPHEIPSWVDDGAVFFITINCEPRGRNQLTTPTAESAIERSLHHQNSCGAWWIHLFLLMPDHLHGLISFSRENPMQSSIQNWKRFLARHVGMAWQRDFFDHRLRHDESLTEKWNYIRENPVRKGLAAKPDDWPHQWTSGSDGSPSRLSVPPPTSTACSTPTTPALSEKSPYQFKVDGHLKKMGAAL